MKELKRLKSKGILGGVCSGIAKSSGTDVWLWRVAFILSGFIPLYALMWVFVKKEDEVEDVACTCKKGTCSNKEKK